VEFPDGAKYWEIIAYNLSKGSWKSGWISPVDSERRAIRIVDVHRRGGKRFDRMRSQS